MVSGAGPAFCAGELSLKYTQIGAFGLGASAVLRGMLTSRTEYILGRNTRSESRTGSGDLYGPVRAFIRNHDLRAIFELDLEARLYTATQVDERGIPLGAKGIESKPSGRTRRYHLDTVDTGERRRMFGYTARRVKTRTTLAIDPPGGPPQTDSETDGWYIDPPAAWLRIYPRTERFYYATSGPPEERDDARVTTTGRRETGFPLILDSKNGRAHNHQRISEFSEAPLDPALFVPPADFKLVPQLLPGRFGYRYPWDTRVRWRWVMLMDQL